mmetsp:Transcript_34250/g.80002  ORF Transcript_34250/g.80002 Transcript_34250/m.80002 type:complete len:208 (+) Transcript_34250:829-1452(+)
MSAEVAVFCGVPSLAAASQHSCFARCTRLRWCKLLHHALTTHFGIIASEGVPGVTIALVVPDLTRPTGEGVGAIAKVAGMVVRESVVHLQPHLRGHKCTSSLSIVAIKASNPGSRLVGTLLRQEKLPKVEIQVTIYITSVLVNRKSSCAGRIDVVEGDARGIVRIDLRTCALQTAGSKHALQSRASPPSARNWHAKGSSRLWDFALL